MHVFRNLCRIFNLECRMRKVIDARALYYYINAMVGIKCNLIKLQLNHCNLIKLSVLLLVDVDLSNLKFRYPGIILNWSKYIIINNFILGKLLTYIFYITMLML